MSEPVDDAMAQELYALELALMDPELRRDRARAGALLAEDFVEFGASGLLYTRASVLEMMAAEEGFTRPAVEDFVCRALTPGLMLVTYRTVRTDEETGQRAATLRSSIWSGHAKSWRVRFHQGTRAPSS